MQALIAEGVIGEFPRTPIFCVSGFTPLYLSPEDVTQAAETLCDIMATGRWDRPEFHARAKVT